MWNCLHDAENAAATETTQCAEQTGGKRRVNTKTKANNYLYGYYYMIKNIKTGWLFVYMSLQKNSTKSNLRLADQTKLFWGFLFVLFLIHYMCLAVRQYTMNQVLKHSL